MEPIYLRNSKLLILEKTYIKSSVKTCIVCADNVYGCFRLLCVMLLWQGSCKIRYNFTQKRLESNNVLLNHVNTYCL